MNNIIYNYIIYIKIIIEIIGASKSDYTTMLNIKPQDEVIKLKRIIERLNAEIRDLKLQLLLKSEE